MVFLTWMKESMQLCVKVFVGGGWHVCWSLWCAPLSLTNGHTYERDMPTVVWRKLDSRTSISLWAYRQVTNSPTPFVCWEPPEYMSQCVHLWCAAHHCLSTFVSVILSDWRSSPLLAQLVDDRLQVSGPGQCENISDGKSRWWANVDFAWPGKWFRCWDV